MKKNILLIAALFTLAAGAIAKPIDKQAVKTIAARFWDLHRPASVAGADKLELLTFDGLNHLTVVRINGTGFVIVAGDDCVPPVLAYAFDAPFADSLHPELRYWLNGYESQISEAVENEYKPSQSVSNQWHILLTSGTKDTVGDTIPDPNSDLIAPLLTTRWDQGDPYNAFCPFDSNRHARTVVGCVATAMAQIMKYWNYPYVGEGQHTYNSGQFHNLSADFANTTYLWHVMPNSVFLNGTTGQEAVATLSYHCGVAVDMEYGVSSQGGSGAYSSCGWWANACATSAFIDHFKYDPALYHADRGNDDSAWCALIDAELAAGHPIYYSGHDNSSGHAFVLDGRGVNHFYHFNWGWSGYGDGYYVVNNLAPGPGGGAGSNPTNTFNYGQGAIFGIQPREVEVFDTVDYYDTVCNDADYAHFRNYTILIYGIDSIPDTILHSHDTVFHYHLSIISPNRLLLHSNNGEDQRTMYMYCSGIGFEFPPCSFTYPGHTFYGWCRSRTGDDIIYQPGEVGRIYGNPGFHALWIDTATNAITTAQEDGVAIWPNITRESINFALSNNEEVQVTIIDNYGRVRIQQKVYGGKAKISLSRLPAGTYNILITAPDAVYKSRIIKL